ncbi:unnamed protein product [Vitrella brassicaformis CCMP3155]|uniref:Uncharacterized protein n=1 Tax=Vitrella brassicaformis (strain CCMP3155) TaxID=1169540 RepID=A0A0G4EQJ7_VITBC|nr:unnamed protein product [Vitrella brassicaformis CCMP3155]|eukprot:CEL99911.1 unnamed protein product [Vitrella brassicaformis CCMP3155]
MRSTMRAAAPAPAVPPSPPPAVSLQLKRKGGEGDKSPSPKKPRFGGDGPFAKQQAGLVYKGFYEVASGERDPANRREEGFKKLIDKAKNAGGGLVEGAPDPNKPVFFDQCHVNRWLSGKAPGYCDPALEYSGSLDSHVLEGGKKAVDIVTGESPDPNLNNQLRHTFTPTDPKEPILSPCTALYGATNTGLMEGDIMGAHPLAIPRIKSLVKNLHAKTWLLPENIHLTSRHSIQGFPLDMPVNPRHCTGVLGRGGLGKWGPNNAADSMLRSCSARYLPHLRS